MAKLSLIAGGVRSGKSAFALEWAKTHGKRRLFVATAQAFDDEMRARIAAHQVERADEFACLEAPLNLEDALGKVTDTDVVVIDCLTLFISNLLLDDRSDAEIEGRIAVLVEQLTAAPYHAIVVSNEVGMGIVPDNVLARRFRDLTGRAHQTLAARADELYFAAMGTILRLRPGPVEICEP